MHTSGRLPHARKAIRITRTIPDGGTSREIAYLTVSLPRRPGPIPDLQDWARREWLIENMVHHVRDVSSVSYFLNARPE